MNILLFGPPGAGKGTQSARLVEKQGMRHISTGVLLRKAIERQTSLGTEAQTYIDRGDLVPDRIVIRMVNEALGELSGQDFVLDGFPRTVPQAEALSGQLVEHGLEVRKAIFLDVPHGSLIRRLTGRRVCGDCGLNYHVESHPPQKEGVCNHCEGPVVQRVDDREEAISQRLKVYEESIGPLRDYFGQAGKVVNLDGMGSAEDVFCRIQGEL